jgi:hypothetical protein
VRKPTNGNTVAFNVEEHRVSLENLRRARVKARKTLLKLAIAAEMDPTTILSAEKNRGATLESKLRIARALGMSPAQLFRKRRSA